jgi:hypothetical protein
MTTSWTRPNWKPQTRRAIPLLLGTLSAGLAFAVGLVVAGKPATIMMPPLVTPVTITVPAPAVAAPAPQPPAPEPAPEPKQPRATTPHLITSCLLEMESPTTDLTCSWDQGFPAISADGTLIATRFTPDDGARGWPGLSVHLIDVATSRIVRDVTILSPDEYDPEGKQRDKLLAMIASRTEAAQRVLDAREFRTLVALGENNLYQQTVTTDPTKLHAEFAENLVRAIDPATQTVLWQRRFAVAAPKPHNPDSDCGAWDMRNLSVWWDPTTRVALASMKYGTGGCICSIDEYEVVVRF